MNGIMKRMGMRKRMRVEVVGVRAAEVMITS